MAKDLLEAVGGKPTAEQPMEDASNVKASRDIDSSEGKVKEPSRLVRYVRNKLQESERARQQHERQWLRNVNAYRGKDSGPQFRESEKSDVYVRTTAVKVKAAYAQIVEALLSDSRFPVSVTETRVPEGVSEFAHLKTDMQENVVREADETTGPLGGVGYAGDGLSPEPGATSSNPKFLGGMTEELTKEGSGVIMEEGPSRDPNVPQISPAKELARRMEKVIHDQLEETKARTELRKLVFEMCLLGTGIMKGPLNFNKDLYSWEDGEYSHKVVRTPRSSMVSAFNFYPDPNATCAADMEWAIEHHKMNHAQVRNLAKSPHFDEKALKRVLAYPGNYERKSYEHILDEDSSTESRVNLYEVLEYWGYVSKDMLEEYDITYDKEITGDMVQMNVWISGDEVLRVVVNPFLPQRIPYFVVPYDQDPYSIWGSGVPESMEDTQALMNGFMRLAVDNIALAGNLVFDIDESMLVPGQTPEVYPGKIFWRQAGSTGQAIYGTSFPNTAPANMDMFNRARQMADESTGIPSFAHGQTGVMSPTRTSSGMSMLLSGASLNIKTVIRNIDDELLKPWVEGYYRWNMQFHEDMNIKGDLEIKATGSASLQMKEVRSSRLSTFLQLSANPAVAPLIKLPTIIKELAVAMEMDPEEILNSPEEQQIYAQLMQTQAMQQPAQPGVPGELGGGEVPVPGEPNFTGNTMGAGNASGLNGQPMMEGMTDGPQPF